jgi:hypothetical protein
MPSEYPFTEPSADLHTLLDTTARSILDAGTQCVYGVGLGVLAARLAHRLRAHWTWAPIALALLAPAHALLGASDVTLAVAALASCALGSRWHRRELDTGVDLARLAALRRTPLDLLRRTSSRIELQRRSARGPRGLLRHGELVIATDDRGHLVSIPFDGQHRATHALVVGATGSGKTVTQTAIASAAVANGMGVIVVDPKGDPHMRAQLRLAASHQGAELLEWTPAGGLVYNPYARGSDSEIADKVLAGERFTEPHYLRQAQRYMGHLVRSLRRAGLEVSLRRIVEHLEPQRLETLARTLPEPHAGATHSYLDSLSARQLRDLSGVRDRLAILTESDVGRWLDADAGGGAQFDLMGCVRDRAVVYFSLESDRRPLLSQMLGAAIIQDLQTTVAAMQAGPVATLALIDEFSAVAAEQVVRLFARARSAAVSIVLGTQELSDLRPPGRERLLEQILGNLAVLIAHRQVVPDSADLVTRLAGTRGAWRTSRHSDGRFTRTRRSERILEAERVMELAPGCAAILVLEDARPVRVARVLRRELGAAAERGVAREREASR